ncbi:hypothetical protein SNE40_010571 [Patella caerulea]|uniref:Phosphatidate cytidylyltransferase, mitochondrial n=1 Tax=Patella caerulea TaxID=87958 RepID=A0AAN8JS92_PATCE
MSRLLRYCSSLVDTQSAAALYSRILSSFPSGLQMAFSYGSAVFQQEDHPSKDQNMLDFIFVVDEPIKWHKENLVLNKKHYSFLKYLGARFITNIQDKRGSGVYFNTLIPFENRLIKYGVISTDRLITDLLDWDTLYVSGRLHKPVHILKFPNNQDLKNAMHINLVSAVHCALLLLPETFTEEELYQTITGLSYSGDFRMTIGEDKKKIEKIVKPNVSHFRKLYQSILDNEEHVYWHKDTGKFEQYPNYVSQWHHLNLLPSTVQRNLLHSRYSTGRYPDYEEVLRAFAHDSNCSDHVATSISDIVKSSSWNQSIKGIFTAGVIKSVKYSSQKMKKMLKSK